MSFRRSALRWFLGSLLALLLLVAVGAGMLVLWLRSEPGRRWVGRVIADKVEEHIDGRISFEGIDGPHLDGIRLDGVVLRDRQGRLVGKARSVTAHWTLGGLRARRIDRLVGEAPELNVERLIVRDVPRKVPPEPSSHFTVSEIAVRDGLVDLYGPTLTSIAGSARLDLGEKSTLHIVGADNLFGSYAIHTGGDVEWSDEGPVEVRARASADGGALVAEALVRQAPDAWLIEHAVLSRGTSRATGHGWWSHGRIGVVVDEGVLQQSLLDRLLPSLATGEAVHFRGQARGPVTRLAVTLRTTAGALLPVALRAQINVPRRAGSVAISAGASELHADGRVTTSTIDLRVKARLAQADARRLGIPAEAPIEVRATAHGAPLTPAIRAQVVERGQLWARLDATLDLPARRARTNLAIDELRRGSRTLRGMRLSAAIRSDHDVIAIDDLHLHWDDLPKGYRDAAGSARITRAGHALSSSLVAPTPLGPLTIEGTLNREPGAIELHDLRAAIGASRLRGALRVVDGRFHATIEELLIQPALVRRVQPELEPGWPFEVHGAATGTTSAVELTLRASAGPSSAQLSGTLHPGRNHLRLVGEVDAFDPDVVHPTQTEARLHLEFATDLLRSNEGLEGVLHVRSARGTAGQSSFHRGALEASFHGREFEVSRARLNSPALLITGSGRGTLDGSLHLRYGVLMTDARHLHEVPRVLRALLGIQQILPGRVVEGTIDRPPGQPFEYSYQYLPPGFQQARWLVRMIANLGHET